MSYLPVTDRMPDLLAGACRTPAAAAVFADITTATTPAAVEICRSCPSTTRAACLEWAVRHEDQGVWAALSKDGLRAERLNRGIRLVELRSGEIARRPPVKKGTSA